MFGSLALPLRRKARYKTLPPVSVATLPADRSSERPSLASLVAQSALFDPMWYLAANPDVAAAHGRDTAIVHFCAHGDREGRSPGPLFNSHYYRLHFPGAASSPMGPLEHYLREGRAQGHDWHPSEAATADDVRWAAEAILGRQATEDLIERCLVDHHARAKPFLYGLLQSEEARAKLFAQDDLAEYRVPHHLARTSSHPRKVLAIGSCLLENILNSIRYVDLECQFEHHLQNFGSELPSAPQSDPASYDFQIVGLGMRSITLTGVHARLPPRDGEAHKRFFEECRTRLALNLDAALAWNERYALTTFVLGFIVPQGNQIGRLQSRFELSSFAYLVEELNRLIHAEASRRRNCYYVDLNDIVSSFGKKYYLDDIVFTSDHNAPLTDGAFPEKDADRLEGVFTTSATYPRKNGPIDRAIWAEVVASWRTTLREDGVKLVIVDLDDTLWRGVAAESDMEFDVYRFAGWPEGVAEALQVLKARGIILAIASKNDEALIVKNWRNLIGTSIDIEDFALRAINWQPKAENIADIIRKTNLLPRNVVFVDDNPVEREAVRQAIPDIRTLPANYLTWRRILLWSAETQVGEITAESAARGETIQAMIKREELRTTVSREEFLLQLGIRMTLDRIVAPGSGAYKRALELINKTNQFNTTGRVWKDAEMHALLAQGGSLVAASVSDKMTDYGVTCIAVLGTAEILQVVMSCRIFGLGVETAVLSSILAAHADADAMSAIYHDTGRNHLCADLFTRCGFAKVGDRWIAPPGHRVPFPAHVTLAERIG